MKENLKGIGKRKVNERMNHAKVCLIEEEVFGFKVSICKPL
jgi:hypothetical protein